MASPSVSESGCEGSERGRLSLEAVVDDCELLLGKLRRLHNRDRARPEIQKCLRQLLRFRKKEIRQHRHGLTETASHTLRVVVNALSTTARDPLCRPLFTHFEVVGADSPGMTALSTLVHHQEKGVAELRVLALLVAHSVDMEIELGNHYTQLLGVWAKTLSLKLTRVRDVEAVGRFCLDMLGSDNEDGQTIVDAAALGLLALIPAQFTALKSLAKHGQMLLNACKQVAGCEARALKLSPIVYAGIWEIASNVGVTIPEDSRLGVLMAAHLHANPGLHSPMALLTTHPQVMMPYSFPVFDLASECDCGRVRQLVEAGLASVNVVDPFGLGLFYYAAYYGWRHKGPEAALDMCRCLVELGVDLCWPDEISNAPWETLLDSMIVSSVSGIGTWASFEASLGCFGLSWPDCRIDYYARRRFTRLHEVVLGLGNHYDLRESLQFWKESGDLGEMIDQPDAQGRTVLTWAVEYHAYELAALLIDYGANVKYTRCTDLAQFSLLHLALAAKHVPEDLLVLLVASGADIFARDHEGWTPAHVAASWNNEVALELLSPCAPAIYGATNSGQTVEDLFAE